MYIILMRHGDAEPEEEGRDNRSRQLTTKGMRRVRKSARILNYFLKGRAMEIFASPFERTRATAELVAEECGVNVFHTAEELIQPSWTLVHNHLLMESMVTLLVGHQPLLQNWLITATGAMLKFETASMAVIEYDRIKRQGTLEAYFAPQIRNLKKEDP